MRIINTILLGSFLLTNTLMAMPTIHEYESNYVVKGNTVQALRTQMAQLGPVDQGRAVDALTNWSLKWHYELESGLNFCRLANVSVLATIVVHYPNWIDRYRANLSLQNQWSHYLEALHQHEQVHIAHGKQAAIEMDRMLRSLSPMETCSDLARYVNKKSQQMIADYHEQDRQYDEKTQHGANEGVVFLQG